MCFFREQPTLSPTIEHSRHGNTQLDNFLHSSFVSLQNRLLLFKNTLSISCRSSASKIRLGSFLLQGLVGTAQIAKNV